MSDTTPTPTPRPRLGIAVHTLAGITHARALELVEKMYAQRSRYGFEGEKYGPGSALPSAAWTHRRRWRKELRDLATVAAVALHEAEEYLDRYPEAQQHLATRASLCEVITWHEDHEERRR